MRHNEERRLLSPSSSSEIPLRCFITVRGESTEGRRNRLDLRKKWEEEKKHDPWKERQTLGLLSEGKWERDRQIEWKKEGLLRCKKWQMTKRKWDNKSGKRGKTTCGFLIFWRVTFLCERRRHDRRGQQDFSQWLAVHQYRTHTLTSHTHTRTHTNTRRDTHTPLLKHLCAVTYWFPEKWNRVIFCTIHHYLKVKWDPSVTITAQRCRSAAQFENCSVVVSTFPPLLTVSLPWTAVNPGSGGPLCRKWCIIRATGVQAFSQRLQNVFLMPDKNNRAASPLQTYCINLGSKLRVGVNVIGCLSLHVSSLMNWWFVKGVPHHWWMNVLKSADLKLSVLHATPRCVSHTMK